LNSEILRAEESILNGGKAATSGKAATGGKATKRR
jgi:hypothetical protein